jgi:ribosome recycling factor
MTAADQFIKDLDLALSGSVQRLKTDFTAIRGNRPSVDTIQDIKVNLYDQMLSIKELGALSILPPRTIQVMLWDKDAVGPVMKAIEDARLGLSASSDGTTIRATLSPLGDERREELAKTIKKTSEAARIQIRARRDETMKQLKEAEGKKEITEDDSFKAREKVQKSVDKANREVEAMVKGKLEELGE